MAKRNRKKQKGWGLLETTLTLGALSALSLGIYMVLGPASATAQVKREQDNLRDLSSTVERSFGLLGSFSAVSTMRVVNDDLAPARMVDDGMLVSAWGGAVDLAPFQVGRPDDAFVVTYFDTPADVCARLASAVARSAFDIRVGGVTGTSLYDANGLNPATAAQACGAGDGTVAFIFHSGLVAGQAIAAAPITLAPDTTVGPGSSTVPASIVVPPAGGVGDAGTAAPVVVPPGPGTPPPPPPVTGGGTSPAFTPTTSGGSGGTTPTNEVECAASMPGPQTDTRTLSCPAGQVGHRDQERYGSYSCPEAWEAPAWSGWSDWDTVGSTCTPCPAAQTETLSCPSGQLGEIVRERTFQCSGETGSWNGWAIISNTCADECVAPPSASTPTSRAVAPQTQNVATCPAGQYGQREQSRTVTEAGTTTTTYTCPAPTGLPTSSTNTAWSGTFTYGAWTYTGANTCTPCPSVPQEVNTRWTPTSPGCAAGQYGQRSWEFEERQTRNGSYNCPAGTATLPAISWAPWSAWSSTGATRNSVNTCTSCPAPQTDSRTQWVPVNPGCPAGETGTYSWEKEQRETRTGTYNCPAGTTSLPAITWPTWTGAWVDTGATRNLVDTCEPVGGCSELTDRQSGTLDTMDAYYSISYSVNGVYGGCSATRQNDGIYGAGNCYAGTNGVLTLEQWEAVAAPGDTYIIDGSDSGWEAEAHQFWTWDFFYYTATVCP